MVTKPSKEKLVEWQAKAAKKNAIIPEYFEVFPSKVHIICGTCKNSFKRTLILNRDEPVYVCPNSNCKARNWVPVYFDLK
ncbi:MAG: hypothetical protein KDD56_01940 [Bdellovibrionales bacterium]|nr:hypothetical protein [Bdellovibrionales bacterium]